MQRSKHSTEAASLSPPTRKGLGAARMACLAALACVGAAHADYTVPVGESAPLNGITLDLQCENLVVNGTLTAENVTFKNIGHITIGSGGTLTATGSTFDVAQSNVHKSGTFNGAAYTATPSCGGTNPPTVAPPTPVPANGPLGLALMGLLLGAALPVRRWLQQRRQSARGYPCH